MGTEEQGRRRTDGKSVGMERRGMGMEKVGVAVRERGVSAESGGGVRGPWVWFWELRE